MTGIFRKDDAYFWIWIGDLSPEEALGCHSWHGPFPGVVEARADCEAVLLGPQWHPELETLQ
jgi:hypothetical protein